MDRDRRRNPPARGGTIHEEIVCWGHALQSLKPLNNIYSKSSTTDTISRVNRLISTWPTDDTLPAEGLRDLSAIQGKLTQGLTDIMNTANDEVKAIDDVLERVTVLLALRKASAESSMDKNLKKRSRVPSLSPAPSAGNSRPVSITLPPRTGSVGPGAGSRDSRKKDSVVKHQMLQPGRKVVFRPPKSTETEEGTWIVAIVIKYIGPDKHGGKYEVQDAEPQDDGQPGAVYTANLKSIVPLPDPDAPAGSAAHISSHPVFPVGSVVLALYPDTSCFYRAEVITTPSSDRASPSSKYSPSYRVKFEDDDDMIHDIPAFWVVKFPTHLL